MTVDEAARHLGLTVDAVRKRVQRRQIAYEKDEAGRVRIVLDEDETLQDERLDATGRDAELLEELRRTNELLREVITTRDEEIRRRDTVIMNMTEAMKALNPPAPEDTSEARESPESSGPTGELGELREELDAERIRREMAENTLREGMGEERRRREEAERERGNLRRDLFASREPRESPQTVEEEPERAGGHGPLRQDRRSPHGAGGGVGGSGADGEELGRVRNRRTAAAHYSVGVDADRRRLPHSGGRGC